MSANCDQIKIGEGMEKIQAARLHGRSPFQGGFRLLVFFQLLAQQARIVVDPGQIRDAVGGGSRDDIDYLYNHQICESAGHMHVQTRSAIHDPEAYRKRISQRHELPAESCATLGTA